MDNANDVHTTGGTELLYVWISSNETGFIQEQGFNFSPKYRFELTRNNDQQVYELTCKETSNHPHIWKTAQNNIVGLTAIVGENGTDKSSLMRYLMEPTYEEKWIHIYRIDGSIKAYHNFTKGELHDKTGLVSDVKEKNEQNASAQDLVLNAQTRVYISNAWNSLPTSIQTDEDLLSCLVFSPDAKVRLSRIFTSRMEDNIPAYPESHVPNQKTFGHPSKVKDIDFDELIVLYYYSHIFSDMTYDRTHFPKNTIISFNFYDHFIRTIMDFRKAYGNLYFRNFAEGRDPDMPFWDAYMALYWELCVTMNETPNAYQDPVNFVHSFFSQRTRPPVMDEEIWEYYHDAYREITGFEATLTSWASRSRVVGGRKFITTLSYAKEDQQNSFICFCHYISQLMRKRRSFVLKYIHIDISPVSSGEQAMQNIFAYLHLIPSFNQVFSSSSSTSLRSNVLLLLDEVDLYMHPEWQRNCIALLIDRLEQEYPDTKMQIVLTTHSPLVLSDIPSRSIIYLRNKDNKCTVVDGPKHKETFGANIFTLLKDSFYLKKSLGQFALTRIDAVIKDLQKLKEHPEDTALREQCRSHKEVINIIGEPVVKRKLQELYSELFNDDCEITYKQQLAELSSMLNSSDPETRDKCKALLDNLLSKMKDNQ